MILRLIRGRGNTAEIEALCAELKARLGPASGEVAGPARFHLGTRPGEAGLEVIVTVFWPSAEAAVSSDRRKVSPLAVAERHLVDVAVDVFEIDETILRSSTEEPAWIRVGTGTFSKPGSDIEMLDVLRRRAPLVGDEMTEAFVGRRIVGRAVEVTFVSAWRKPPDDHPLEDAFWPDIALRYDRFEVGVYRTVPFGD